MRNAAARGGRHERFSARRILIAGVAIGALVGSSLAYAQAPTMVGPSGGLKFDARVLRTHPQLAGRVAMYPHVRHNAAQAAAIKSKLASGKLNASGTTTIPYWTTSVVSPADHNTYSYDMVGSSPYATTPAATTITVQPIVVTIKVGGASFDPTRASSCGDTKSVWGRFLGSPLFNAANFVSNKQAMGARQLEAAFMRANFWTQVHGTNYAVNLSLKPPVFVTETVSGTVMSIPCGNGKNFNFGSIDYNTWASDVQTLAQTYATPGEVAVILTYDTAEAAPGGGGYYLGWHDAFAVSAGVQTYGTGSYFDAGLFSGISDVSTWTHELSEWMDDPFAQESVTGGGSNNLTPAWGNVGQVVGGCQNNLEVGDPLSGTLYAMPTPAGVTGITYHQQDLAFHDWFYRTPVDKAGPHSTGTGGEYSVLGVFTGKEVAVCTSSNETTITNSEGISPKGNPRLNQ
ncbi:MAG: hypothetical protein ABSD80_08380 [Caulobacteraceae bacterium]|jgi:hypothetical protein